MEKFGCDDEGEIASEREKEQDDIEEAYRSETRAVEVIANGRKKEEDKHGDE